MLNQPIDCFDTKPHVSFPLLVPGYEEPAAILVLMEGGELVVHDLAADKAVSRAPQHFMQRFQSQPSVTAARLRIIPTGRVPLQGLQVCAGAGVMRCSYRRFIANQLNRYDPFACVLKREISMLKCRTAFVVEPIECVICCSEC